MSVDLARLTAPFPKEAIKHRKAHGGQMLAYVEGHAVIHRLNDATGNCWSMEVKEVTSQAIGANTLMVARVALTLPDCGTREALGVQMVHERGGEDLVKGCLTDALKKAATLFGVGLELYGPDYESDDALLPNPQRNGQRVGWPRTTSNRNEPPPPRLDEVAGEVLMITAPQARNLHRLARKAGMDERAYYAELKRLYKHESEKLLTREEASSFIEKLMVAVGEAE